MTKGHLYEALLGQELQGERRLESDVLGDGDKLDTSAYIMTVHPESTTSEEKAVQFRISRAFFQSPDDYSRDDRRGQRQGRDHVYFAIQHHIILSVRVGRCGTLHISTPET